MNSIYQNIFDLIHTYIYGGVEMDAMMQLTNTLMSTTACVFCVAVPFMIVYKAICIITGR